MRYIALLSLNEGIMDNCETWHPAWCYLIKDDEIIIFSTIKMGMLKELGLATYVCIYIYIYYIYVIESGHTENVSMGCDWKNISVIWIDETFFSKDCIRKWNMQDENYFV